MLKKALNHIVIMTSPANYNTFEKNFTRILESSNRKNSKLLIALHSENEDECKKIKSLVQDLSKTIKNLFPNKDILSVEIIQIANEKLSDAKAINKAILYVNENLSKYKFLSILSDKSLVSDNWMKYMERATTSKFITTQGLLNLKRTPVKNEDLIAEGRVGFAGPATFGFYNEQGTAKPPQLNSLGLDKFSAMWHSQNVGDYVLASYLKSHFMTFTYECINDLWDDNIGGLFDEEFNNNSYHDNDLCFRALNKGWRGVVCADCYMVLDKPSAPGLAAKYLFKQGLSENFTDKLTYLRKYSEVTQKEQKVVAAYYVDLKSINDLAQLKTSFARSAKILDGLSFMFVNNPAVCLSAYDSSLVQQLSPIDSKFIADCSNLSKEEEGYSEKLSSIITEWIKQNLNLCNEMYHKFKQERGLTDDLNYSVDFTVDVWNKEFNEREAKNILYSSCEKLNPDWVIALDLDEVLEDRITKSLIQRWTTHPNVDKSIGTIGITHHWESANLVRTDEEFKGKSELRIWRTRNKSPQKLVAGAKNGLNAGIPEYGMYNQIVTGMRVRNLSLVRDGDRKSLYHHYNQIDEDCILGGKYTSFLNRNVPVSIYFPSNGIALSMLSHKDDEVELIERWLEQSYMLCDRQVIVWTEEWKDEDRKWLELSLEELPSKEEWKSNFPTGPCWEFAIISKLYKAEIVAKKLDLENEVGLAHCRNAAIEHLISTNDGSIRWAVVFDPDEETFDYISTMEKIRSLAEDEEVWGYLFRFQNPLNTVDEEGLPFSSPSENIRMFVLEPNGRFKMSGLVHEGFEDTIHQLKGQGVKVNIKDSTLMLTNYGLCSDSKKMANKLKKYATMLVETLEENPHDSRSWLSLGLQLLNDGNGKDAITCFNKACQTATEAYLPFKELGIQHLRMGQYFIGEARRRITRNHPWNPMAQSIEQAIDSFQIALPRIDTGTYTITCDVDLEDRLKTIINDESQNWRV